MRETQYERELKKRLKEEFPGCMILKNDPQKIQGIPDLIILFGKYWAALETKRHKSADRQPNQEYYVDMMKSMSYASFIHPENESDVIDELRKAFRLRRPPRISKS